MIVIVVSEIKLNRHHEAKGHQAGALSHRVQDHAVLDHRQAIRRYHPVLSPGKLIKSMDFALLVVYTYIL